MKDGRIIYYDEKVIVTDYGKTIKSEDREYQDNIKEIIETENILEELFKEKCNLTKKINDNNLEIQYKKEINKVLTYTLFLAPIFSAIVGSLIDKSLLIEEGLKVWQFLGMSGIILSVASFAPFINMFKKIIKIKIKENNGYNLEINEIEKELDKNKELLHQLNLDKSKENYEENLKKQHEDIHNIHLEKYKKIKDLLMLYYEIGENEKEFQKYYDKGMLDSKLEEAYESEEIDTIKTYFKTKK